MLLYQYKARNNAGELVTGGMTASSEQEVVKRLREMAYTPVKVMVGEVPLQAAQRAMPVPVKRITAHDQVVFTTNLASMVNAGIPLWGALNSIAGQLSNPSLGEVVRQVAQKVSEGSSLSDALEKHPKVFTKFYYKMVHVGEMSGTMDAVLRTLALHMEQQEELGQRIKGALIYPAMLITAGTAVVLIILTLVMPRFVTIFKGSGVPLPLPTQIMYEVGLWMQSYWYIILIALGGTVLGVRTALSFTWGRAFWDQALLKLPMFGPLFCDVLVTRFSRTLGVLLGAGVPVREALSILKELIDNTVFAGIVQEVLLSVEKGEGIHSPLKRHQQFPKDAAYMISVGEEAGKMALMLGKVADFYESKVAYAIRNILVFIEPVFIVLLGGVVGVMLASVLLPMFDMVKTIQR